MSRPSFLRRKSAQADASADQPTKVGGKGRPTPTRAEAQAAAKARAKVPTDRRELARQQRQQRGASSAQVRDALRTGDDRYLPKRDKGPVRRFVRDFIDSRLCMAELLVPLLIVIALSRTVSPSFSDGLWSATILLVALDTVFFLFRLRSQLRKRFPDTSTRGASGYAVLRALQVRFLRMPKPQVRLGGRPRQRA